MVARVYRLHPEYRMVRLDDLSADQRPTITADAPYAVTAVLVRRQGDGPAYALSAEAVALIDSASRLAERPGGPDESRSRIAGAAALVLDGVLELRAGERWWSGPPAMTHLDLPVPATGLAPLHLLSRAALEYAARLRLSVVGELARRLYCYNRWPASTSWSRRLATTAAVRAWLDRPATAATLDRAWEAIPPPVDNDRWRIFCHRGATTPTGDCRHKLYVSPRPGHLRDAWELALPVFTAHEVPIFKIADDMYGVLRPDKLVAYVDTPARRDALGADLRRVLSGVPAQGVPFTATGTDDGLLAWAVDPPPSAVTAGRASSWRGWIAERLARAMVQAQTTLGSDPVVDYALRRVRLDGVDTSTWSPSVRRDANGTRSP